ncbi:MAG: tRNA uridine-5-carboxymethylaminomethyl(34) synthesis GTPase MnmE [Phycisphaera sp.]|nr:tRNA uridine-5-carboxymethylaminomethyl(34) synthesis GTPase MnmE [Phycisphaera sp.]
MRRADADADARETIVAVASPPGRGVRGIVRVSGPAARAMARGALGLEPRSRGMMRARVAIPADARNPEGEPACACPVLAFWMESGASFTGEDSLELVCTGAPALLEIVSDALLSHARAAGHRARLAQRGEFAYRAFRSGRLGLEAAEAIAARIAATNDAELTAAAELARGAFASRAGSLVARLAETLALVEAGIDFTDQEDVVAIDAATLAARTSSLAVEAAALRGAVGSRRAHAVPLVALGGAPNAGKSSLFNALVGRTRSATGALAGTTRDAILARVAVAPGLEVDLADLAGLEPDAADARCDARTPAAIAEAMQRRAREILRVADIVVRCTPVGAARVAIDGGSGVEASGNRVVEVATKCDEPGAFPPDDAVATSARTGAGLDALRSSLAARLRADQALRRAELASILPRHDAALAAAETALRDAADLAARDAAVQPQRLRDPEFAASLLRAALDALGAIAGPVHPDDVLGLVFSRFCIGK